MQIEQAYLPIDVVDDEHGTIAKRVCRINELVNQRSWVKMPSHQSHTIRRGFVNSVTLTLAQFEQHAAKIASEHPIAEDGWVLTDCEPEGLGLQEHGYYWPIGMPERSAIGELAYHCAFRYQTREAAMKALQRACYVVARKRAERLPNTDDI